MKLAPVRRADQSRDLQPPVQSSALVCQEQARDVYKFKQYTIVRSEFISVDRNFT